MAHLLPLLALAVLLAVCGSSERVSRADVSEARVSTGRTYVATTVQVSDAETGALVLDVVRLGGRLTLTFDDSTRFTARLSVPHVVLARSGGTLHGDVDETVTGTYAQHDGRLSFSIQGGADAAGTFLPGAGWTISPDGGTARSQAVDDGACTEVVLTRR